IMITTQTKKFINFAINVAHKAPIQKHRMGCVIVKKGVPLSIGWNNCAKTHPRASRYPFPFLHCELHAMIGVPYEKLHGASIFIARIRKKTPTGLAKPCPYCEEELNRAGISKVFYTTDTKEIGFNRL